VKQRLKALEAKVALHIFDEYNTHRPQSGPVVLRENSEANVLDSVALAKEKHIA